MLSPLIRLLKWSFYLLILLILLLVALLLGSITDQAIPDNPIRANAQAAQVAKDLPKRLVYRLSRPASQQFFLFRAQELNSILAFTERASPRLQGYSHIDQQGIHIALRLRIPITPLGRYIGLDARIPPSQQGIELEGLQLGHIPISGKATLWLTEWLLNLFLGDQQGSLFFKSVHSVQTNPNIALLSLQTPPDLKERLEKISNRIKNFSAEMNWFADTKAVRHYFQQLRRIEKHFPAGSSVALENIIQPLFAGVSQRSRGRNPIEENRAAILALGVYLGSYHFEKLIGPIAPEGYQAHLMPIRVTLAGRKDLRLHFIYSATLKVLSDQGASFALGEFKELLDSNAGGSGFSFVDLSADRAGILFAQQATQSTTTARYLQQQTQQLKRLLPSIADLPEGLTETEFAERFASVDSPAYKAMLQKIDHRLQQLALYQPSP